MICRAMARPSPAPLVEERAVSRPVELLKKCARAFPAGSCRRDSGSGQRAKIADALRRDGDLRARVAVEHGVAQKVIKDALQFVRVAPNGERLGCGERAGEVFLSQHRLKLKRKLLEQAGEVGGTVLQLDGGEIEARDLKKFVDEILETVGLVERDGEVFLPQRRAISPSSCSSVRCPITDESGVLRSCARYMMRSFFRCSASRRARRFSCERDRARLSSFSTSESSFGSSMGGAAGSESDLAAAITSSR